MVSEIEIEIEIEMKIQDTDIIWFRLPSVRWSSENAVNMFVNIMTIKSDA
jgi:hypothetical protein